MSQPYRPPWHKRMLRSEIAQRVAARLIALLVRLIWMTCRIEREVHPEAEPFLHHEHHAIFCFWHGRLLVMPIVLPKHRPIHALVSFHLDGALISKFIACFGLQTVRGSSSKGGRQATDDLLERLKAGGNVVITPDGPRGPALQASRGALHLARLSGRPMIPMAFGATRPRELNSWDRFRIPLPFGRIRIVIGAPIWIDAHCTLSQLKGHKNELERALNDVAAQADKVKLA